MADVFISYRHVRPDQDLAAELKNYLNENRVSHFIDTGLRIGQNWIEVIDRELRACQSLVVLLSSESIRSDMVRHEVKLAHQWNKRIFPVRVDYDGALPYDLGAYLDSIQYKLWRSSEPFAPICGAILDGVREGPEQARDGIEPSSEALRRLGEVTELRGAPLPSADPRLETGGLKPGRSGAGVLPGWRESRLASGIRGWGGRSRCAGLRRKALRAPAPEEPRAEAGLRVYAGRLFFYVC